MADRLLAFEHAVGLLESGGVLLLGTDTLPGFHCRADLSAPVARIRDLKGRQTGKSLLVLAGSMEQAALVTGTLAPRQSAYCRRCWPGPFSLILPAGEKLADRVNEGGVTVAVRVPDLADLRALILAVGFPLVSTSANLSGGDPCVELGAAGVLFADQVDGVWAPNRPSAIKDDPSSPGASALIDLTTWPPVELRKGPLRVPPAHPEHLDGGSHAV